MLTKLIVDNFKAIEHLELDLRPFQVFVGPNDSGKSTIRDSSLTRVQPVLSMLARAPIHRGC